MRKMEVWTLENGHIFWKGFDGEEFRKEANDFFVECRNKGLPIITRSYDVRDPYNSYRISNNKIKLWNTKLEDWFLPMIEKDTRGWEDDVPGYVLSYVYEIANMDSLYDGTVDELEFIFRGQTIKVVTEFYHGDWDEEGKHEEIEFIKDGQYLSSFGESR